MARVKVNRRLRRDYNLPQNHSGWTDAARHVGASAIAAAAPLETGFLKSSFRTTTVPGSNPTVRYVAAPDYAIFPEVGTGIYGPLRRWITPVRAKALSWIDAATGARVFARRVRGQPPQRYFKKGLEATFGRRNVRYYGASGRTGRVRIPPRNAR